MDYSKVVAAFYVGIRAGLIDEKHYRKMGNAIWLFMWCVHRQTSVHEGRGIVMRGQAITYELIHAETGYAIETIRTWMKILKKWRYVSTKFCGNGFQIWIEGQKKSKIRVGKSHHPREVESHHSSGKSHHPSPVAQTKDKDLNSPPNCPNILQDNTTAAGCESPAGLIFELSKKIQLPFERQTQKDAEQRRQILLRQSEQIRRNYARPA